MYEQRNSDYNMTVSNLDVYSVCMFRFCHMD